jgi:hypothetical protein
MREKRGVVAFDGTLIDEHCNRESVFFKIQEIAHLLDWHGLRLDWLLEGDGWVIYLDKQSYGGITIDGLYQFLVGIDSQQPEGSATTYPPGG